MEQEAQLLQRDRTMRRVSWNLANCHATVQKLLVRQVLNKSKLWSWRFSWRQQAMCNKHVHSTMMRPSRFHCAIGVIKKPTMNEQWHQLGHMQVCTSLQRDNHARTPPLSFLQAGCPSCRPTNSVKALKGYNHERKWKNFMSRKTILKSQLSHLLN